MEIQYTHEVFRSYIIRIFADFPIRIVDINSARNLLTKKEFLAIVSNNEKDFYPEESYFRILDFISDNVKEYEKDQYLSMITSISNSKGFKMIGKDFKKFSRKLCYVYTYFENFPVRPPFYGGNTFVEKIESSLEDEKKMIKAMFEDIIDRRNILLDIKNQYYSNGNNCLSNKIISIMYLTLKRGLLD